MKLNNIDFTDIIYFQFFYYNILYNMMNLMKATSQEIFKLKYLKYKQKYLELKGGKICPSLGFHQHISECWHDAYITMMLYTDNMSDIIQHILENYEKSFKTLEELVEDILNFAKNNQNLQILLPLNIDANVYGKYERYCRTYFLNLFNRYFNERIKLEKDIIAPKKGPKSVLVRQNSLKESLYCTSNIFNILKINNETPTEYNVITHGGLHESYSYFISCTYNYYLMNYILPDELKTKTIEEKQDLPRNFIGNQLISFDQLFDTSTSSQELKKKLSEMKDSINKCDAIYIGLLSYTSELNKGNFIPNENINRKAHMVSMFTCDKKLYYYDNEGIEKYKLVGGMPTEGTNGTEGTEGTNGTEKSIHATDIKEEYERAVGKDKFDVGAAVHSRDTRKSFVEFDWKKYFIDIINTIIDSIREKQTKNVLSRDYFAQERKKFGTFFKDAWKNCHIQNIILFSLRKFEKGKSIVQKEEKYYTNAIKLLDTWDMLNGYKLDPVRIDRFILNNNVTMLDLLVRYQYFRDYLTKSGKLELLKQLQKKMEKELDK